MSDLNEIKRGDRRRAPGRRRRSRSIATMTFDTRGHTMMGVSPEEAVAALAGVGRRCDRRQLRERPRRAHPGHRRRCARRRPTSCSSRSRTPGMPELVDMRAVYRADPDDDGRPGPRDARCRGDDRRRLLRQHARPPSRDRGARSTLPSGRDRGARSRSGSSSPRSSARSAGREQLDMIRAIEDLGFDSIWLGEHLLYRWEDRPAARPVGGVDRCWRPSPRSRTRVEFGPLVACTNFHNPALLAKQAATIDEISGGRFVLGLGAGWNETEFRAFGFPYDHRVDRFEEAFTIIRTLLRRRRRSTSMGGSTRPAIASSCRAGRARRAAAAHRLERAADAAHDDAVRRRLEHVVRRTSATRRRASRPLRDVVDEACRDVGRDPATVDAGPRPSRSGCPAARVGSRANDEDPGVLPLEGSPARMADEFRAYAAAGLDRSSSSWTPSRSTRSGRSRRSSRSSSAADPGRCTGAPGPAGASRRGESSGFRRTKRVLACRRPCEIRIGRRSGDAAARSHRSSPPRSSSGCSSRPAAGTRTTPTPAPSRAAAATPAPTPRSAPDGARDARGRLRRAPEGGPADQRRQRGERSQRE